MKRTRRISPRHQRTFHFGQGVCIRGHAGRFETALMMAIRPDLVFADGLAQTEDVSKKELGLMVPLTGATMQVNGAWGAGPGYTDEPAAATAEEGKAMLEVIVEEVAGLLVNFHKMGGSRNPISAITKSPNHRFCAVIGRFGYPFGFRPYFTAHEIPISQAHSPQK